MFTGIIENFGIIEKIKESRFVISHDFEENFVIGESIGLSGMCSTVVKINKNSENKKSFEVDIIKVSRERTIFKNSKIGDLINLERAAKIGQRNSGHNVTGHIDEVGEILNIIQKSDFSLFRIGIEKKNRKLLVDRGSVAVNGISLTVSDVSDLNSETAWFEVSIIPHTLKITNLKTLKIKNKINLEFDILGKYALNLV